MTVTGARGTLASVRKRARSDESGASMVLAIFMLVVMFTMFGIGFDIMRAAYLRSTLNNDLDAAVAAAAAQVRITPTGQVVIDRAKALQVARETYAAARVQHGGLFCLQPGAPTCWVETEFTVDTNRNVITYGIWDANRHLWAPFWDDDGIQVQVIESSAILRNADERRYQ